MGRLAREAGRHVLLRVTGCPSRTDAPVSRGQSRPSPAISAIWCRNWSGRPPGCTTCTSSALCHPRRARPQLHTGADPAAGHGEWARRLHARRA
jgi:hypothetical protein